MSIEAQIRSSSEELSPQPDPITRFTTSMGDIVLDHTDISNVKVHSPFFSEEDRFVNLTSYEAIVLELLMEGSNHEINLDALQSIWQVNKTTAATRVHSLRVKLGDLGRGSKVGRGRVFGLLHNFSGGVTLTSPENAPKQISLRAAFVAHMESDTIEFASSKYDFVKRRKI